MEFFKKIVNQFQVEGELVSCERYGEGHINATYLAVMEKGGVKTDYILQKINNTAFPNVKGLMNNIKLVTEFNRAKIRENGGNPDRESLSLIYTKSGGSYYHAEEDDGYYRMYIFITDAVAYQSIEKPEHFYQSAVAFGNFAKLLSAFDAKELFEVIPGFHNTVKRFENLEKSIKADKMGRAKFVQEEIEFAYKRKDIVKIVVDFCGCNPDSVIPSDYCYNRLNDGIDYVKSIHLFEYIKRNHYLYRGLNYDYKGPVNHKPKGGKEYQIGKVVDGKFYLLENFK